MAGFWDGYAGGQTATATPAPAAPKASGGIGGWLYDHTLKPVVDTVTSLPGDAIHVGNAARIAGGSILSGHHGDALNQDKQRSLDEMKKSSYGKYFGANVNDVQNQGTGNTLEKIGGRAASNAINVMAPEAGAGIKTAKAGAGLGIKYGAAGGVASGMEQGGGGAELTNDALLGGTVGAVLGGTGGAIAGKLASRGAKAATTTPSKANPLNLFQNAAKGQGVRDAQRQAATEARDFAGDPKGVAHAGTHDAQGNEVGINQVSERLRSYGLTPDEPGMQAYHDLMTGEHGYISNHNGSILQSVDGVHVSDPLTAATKAIKNNQLSLGQLGKTGAARDAHKSIEAALNDNMKTGADISGSHSANASNILDTIQALQAKKSALPPTADSTPGHKAVIDAVVNHLHSALESNGKVNAAVKGYRIPPEDEMAMRNDLTNQGVTDVLQQHIIDTINNSEHYKQLRSAQQDGVVAGNLAAVARRKAADTVPQGPKPDKSVNVTPYETMVGLTHPAAAAAVAAKHAGGPIELMGKVASKINPKAYQAGKTEALPGAAEYEARQGAPRPVEPAPAPEAAPAPAGPISTPGSTSLVRPGQEAAPARIGFDGQSPEIPLPVTAKKTVPAAPVLDARLNSRTTSLAQAHDPGIPPVDLRSTALPKNLPTRTVTKVNGSTPSPDLFGALTGRTRPGQEAQSAAYKVTPEYTPRDASGVANRVETPAPVPEPTPSRASNDQILGVSEAKAVARAAAPVARGAVSAAKGTPSAVLAGTPGMAQSSAALAGVNRTGGQSDQETQVASAPQVDTASADTTSAEPEYYSKASLAADLARDPKNAATYISIYKALNDGSKASATQQKAITGAKNAESALSSIESSFNAAGGGQGPLAGAATNLFGHLGLNSNAATYNDTAVSLAASLYKALGNTGTISDKDQQFITSLIPKTTDTDATARSKISQLETLLQAAQQNSLATN